MKRPISSVVCLVAAASTIAFVSCGNSRSPVTPAENQSGSAAITVKVGNVGALGKTAIELQHLYITLSAPSETTIYDTFSLSGNGLQTISKTYSNLASLVKTWTLSAEVRDVNDSLIHSGDTSFIVPARSVVAVTLNLGARYSMLNANFFPIRDSVTRCRLLIDGGTVADTSFAKQALLGDTVKLSFDYLKTDVAQRVTLEVYGNMWGFDTLLYTGDTLITPQPGKDTGYSIVLRWVGPATPPSGEASMSVVIGAVGTVTVNGWLFNLFPTWSALGSGTNGDVYALAFDKSGNLYAGGSFTTAGGVAANYIAKWDGSSWSALGTGLNGGVSTLAVDRLGNLYAGGGFTTAGGVAANWLAKWDGSSWSALGTGISGGYGVSTLAIDSSGNLIAGGEFTTAGGVTVNDIARWDGSSWSALGTGMSNGGYRSNLGALMVDGSGNIYACGWFTAAGGVAANHIAKWDGSTWSALGTGLDNNLSAFAIDGSGNIYVGGQFTTAGGVAANRIAKWDGSSWSALGSGLNAIVFTLAIDGSSNLYAGGQFSTAGGVAANWLAKWDGSSWSALGSETNSYVYTLAVDGSGNLYAGGNFTTAGGTAANYIAEWK